MTKHVDHLLIAYVEGQLRPRRAVIVRQHVAACPACREKLARYERLSADLRLALGQTPAPREAQIGQWWQIITARLASPVRGHVTPILRPVVLSLLLLAAPLAAGVAYLPASRTPQPVGTYLAPGADTTLDPPSIVSEAGDTSQAVAFAPSATPVATSALSGTPLPAAPVPLAPTTP
jgi:anti-sigma factor RsiW